MFDDANRMKNIILAIVALGLLSSCHSTLTRTLHLRNIPMAHNGPVFEGPLTLHTTTLNPLKDSLKAWQCDASDLVMVVLKSASVECLDSMKFEGLGDMEIQFSARGAGVARGGRFSTASGAYTPLPDSLLALVLPEDTVYIATDINVQRNQMRSIHLNMNLEFELQFQK